MSLQPAKSGKINILISFLFSDNTELTIEDTLQNEQKLVNVHINEELNTETDIPVGVNSANVLDLEIDSKNNILVPENENSPYYGLMNNSAIIHMSIKEEDDESSWTIRNFGTYYVTRWKSNITNDTPNRVKITAVGILGIISNKELPDVEYVDTTDIKSYVMDVLTHENQELDTNHKFNLSSNNIIFNEFPVMQFSNLDTTSIGSFLNGISQCTLTSIYSDRTNNIKTDYLCDDQEEEAEYYINVMTGAENNSSNLVDYDGVKVNYSLGTIKPTESLASLSNQSISGSFTFNNIKLPEATYSIDRIEVTSKDSGVYIDVTEVKFNKNKLKLTVEVEYPTTVDINVLGRELDSTTLVYERPGENQLEITNRVLWSDYIPKYLDEINTLIDIKNNSIQVEGYFTTKLELGDIVYINCENAMNISGYYKIYRLDWDLNQYPKCVLYGIKTFDKTIDINSITNNLNDKLELTIAGLFPNTSDFVSLTEKENNVVNLEYNDQLSVLRELLYGGN